MKKLILAAAALMFVAACETSPPPPPPPPTAAVAVRQYMVFFDFDRANITAQAAATIKQAADTAKMSAGSGVSGRDSNTCAAEGRRRGIDGEELKAFVAACMSGGPAVTRVAVTGHTDTSGSADYNMALSLRRANAVKDALVREGIPAAAIGVTGRGETTPLVQTGDNVKEPQNRRVEIVLQ